MTTSRSEQLLMEAMAKHLPPSAASLRLVDIGGRTSAVFMALRADLDVVRDARRQQGNLDFGRPGVFIVPGIILHNDAFLVLFNRHCDRPTFC